MGVNSVFHITRCERFSSSAASADGAAAAGRPRGWGRRACRGAAAASAALPRPPPPLAQRPEHDLPPATHGAYGPGPRPPPRGRPAGMAAGPPPRRVPSGTRGRARGAFPAPPAWQRGGGPDENLQSAGLHVAGGSGREPGRCGAACGGAGSAAGLGEVVTRGAVTHSPPPPFGTLRPAVNCQCSPTAINQLFVSPCQSALDLCQLLLLITSLV
ncbi:uncharacterized protein LOC134554865 [Prinia subflava]|uniref:uncharacterized protein LOC134554865 n=1 Tax=Prinia subflava TaxID=208062 RepID=UPI002FDF86C7